MPTNGAVSSERTKIWVAYDNIYFYAAGLPI